LAHRDRSELDAAVVDLTAVLSANPKSASALVRRGETLELKAAKDAAIADYRATLALPEPAGTASEPHRTARARLLALGATP
jgi:predicted TPR repeat methyltransferase